MAAEGQAPQRLDTTRAPVVHAVLFYSPTCPHCRELITHGLPPLRQRFGERLQIAAVNVATEGGYALYDATLNQFGVPREGRGVPTLVVASRVLVGAVEIPAELPGIVERGLAAGGVDWPEVPLLRQALAEQSHQPGARAAAESAGRAPAPQAESAARVPAPQAESAGAGRDRTPAAAAPRAPEPEEASRTALPAPTRSDSAVAAARVKPKPRASSSPAPHDTAPATAPVAIGTGEAVPLPARSARDRFLLDPIGNSVSVVVLLMMVAVLVLVIGAISGRDVWLPHAPGWTVPALAALGVSVAAYLAFVELIGTQAVCGPVGDCNTVQQSDYARLFGVPVGLLGVGGYLTIIAAWTIGAVGRVQIRNGAWLAIWMMALIATLFSVYLTFLEPFVIGATCAWCVSSALIATLILTVATPAAARILHPRSDRPA